MTSTAFHLVPESWYRDQAPDQDYLPESYLTDGFVHLTHGDDAVIAVGNRFYRDDPRPYLLLTVDLEQISSEVRYEDPDQRYPHIHGPIDRCAILEVRDVHRGPDSNFLSVGDET